MPSTSRPLTAYLARLGWMAAAVMAVLTLPWVASLVLVAATVLLRRAADGSAISGLAFQVRITPSQS